MISVPSRSRPIRWVTDREGCVLGCFKFGSLGRTRTQASQRIAMIAFGPGFTSCVFMQYGQTNAN
jgi:hypothetical protein